LFNHQYKPITILLAEIEVFLNRLTEDSIDHAITCFKDGLQSRKVLPSNFDSRNAHITCNRILRLTEKTSTARTIVCQIPSFWFNLDGLIQSSNLNMIEAKMTRVFCMQGAWRFHNWLLCVVPAAVDKKSGTGWIDDLAQDVRTTMEQGKSGVFCSASYLPELEIQREYTIPATPFRYDQREHVISNLSSILRHWLHFPADEASLIQLSLINIVVSKSSTSILFLDVIWEMYKTPFWTVFNDRWNVRTGKSKIILSLREFEKQFKPHSFATPGSIAHQKLEYLENVIQWWINDDGIDHDSNPAPMVSRPATTQLVFIKF
jgi:hypothetical protein